jgi:hypothetical protein
MIIPHRALKPIQANTQHMSMSTLLLTRVRRISKYARTHVAISYTLQTETNIQNILRDFWSASEQYQLTTAAAGEVPPNFGG